MGLIPLHYLGSSPSQDTVQVSRDSVDSELDQGASHLGPTTPKHSTAVAKVRISWPKIPQGILLVFVHHIFQKLQVLKSPVYSWTTHFTCTKALNCPHSQTCLNVVPTFSPFFTFLPKTQCPQKSTWTFRTPNHDRDSAYHLHTKKQSRNVLRKTAELPLV